jgi:hypothetical protein
MLKVWPASVVAVVLAFVSVAAHAEDLAVDRLAEGRTSASPQVGIVAQYRMFTVPILREICPGTPYPFKLVVPHQPLRMVRGEWFPYQRIVVLAYDGQGHLLPGVPIQIGVEHVEPPILDLRENMIASNRVLPLRVGTFRIEIAPACVARRGGGELVNVVVKAEVVEP